MLINKVYLLLFALYILTTSKNKLLRPLLYIYYPILYLLLLNFSLNSLDSSLKLRVVYIL